MKEEFALIVVFLTGMLLAESIPWTNQTRNPGGSLQHSAAVFAKVPQTWNDSLYPKVAFQSQTRRSFVVR